MKSVQLGLMTADPDGRFHATPLLETLRTGVPGSLRGFALTTTMPAQWLAWNEFTHAVRAGETRVRAALGTDFFTYLDQHPDQARDFAAGLDETTVLWASAAAREIDTADVTLAVDVGGSNGNLLHLLQQVNPRLLGIVFDRPTVVAEAVAETKRAGLEDSGRGALTDMTMLALVPGQERSVAEYDALFKAAGLRWTAVRRTDAPHSVIEAVAAPGRTDG